MIRHVEAEAPPDAAVAPTTDPETRTEGLEESFLRGLLSLLRRRRGTVALWTLILLAAAVGPIVLHKPNYQATAVVQGVGAYAQDIDGTPGAIRQLPNSDLMEAKARTEVDVITTRILAGVAQRMDLFDDPEFNPRLRDNTPWQRLLAYLPSAFTAPAPSGADAQHDEVLRQLRERLSVWNDGRSQSIFIVFSSHDPKKAATIANMLADDFVADHEQVKRAIDAETSARLAPRLEELRTKLAQSEDALEHYREDAKLLPIGPQAITIASQQLAEFSSQLVSAQVDREQAEAKLRQINGALRSDAGLDSAGDVLNSRLIQNLRQDESNAQQKMAELEAQFGPRYPQVVDAQAKLQVLHQKLAIEIKRIGEDMANQVQVARDREAKLQAKVDDLQDQLASGMRANVRLAALERDAASNRKVYETLYTRLKEIEDTDGVGGDDVSVIAHADVPGSPAPPGKPLLLAVASFFSLGLAVAIAFGRERMQRGIHMAKEAERLTGIPVLGLIPRVASRSPERRVLDDPHGPFAESLRTIHAALVRETPRCLAPYTVAVTSSLPQEGKTTVSISLARLLARHHRVLLVDADQRRPRLGRVLDDDGRGYLHDFLERRKSLADVVQIEDESGLHYVASCVDPAGASAILTARGIVTLKLAARHRYDLVIIDTPPVLPLADARLVAEQADGCLFIVRWEKTPQGVVLNALQELRRASAKIVGIAIMNVNYRALARYDDGYHGYYEARYRGYYGSTRLLRRRRIEGSSAAHPGAS